MYVSSLRILMRDSRASKDFRYICHPKFVYLTFTLKENSVSISTSLTTRSDLEYWKPSEDLCFYELSFIHSWANRGLNWASWCGQSQIQVGFLLLFKRTKRAKVKKKTHEFWGIHSSHLYHLKVHLARKQLVSIDVAIRPTFFSGNASLIVKSNFNHDVKSCGKLVGIWLLQNSPTIKKYNNKKKSNSC